MKRDAKPDKERDDEETLFVGMRVSELPRPYVPSTMRHCQMCDEVVWVSKHQLRQSVKADRIVCVECALKELEREEREKAKLN